MCALLAGGGYAEYAVAPAPQCLPVPSGLDPIAAAALPETCFTVWTNVFDRGRLATGETILVHGGSSGIGTMAIQMATAFGARVLVTAGSAEKCAACERLGAARRSLSDRGLRSGRSGHPAVGVDVILAWWGRLFPAQPRCPGRRRAVGANRSPTRRQIRDSPCGLMHGACVTARL